MYSKDRREGRKEGKDYFCAVFRKRKGRHAREGEMGREESQRREDDGGESFARSAGRCHLHHVQIKGGHSGDSRFNACTTGHHASIASFSSAIEAYRNYEHQNESSVPCCRIDHIARRKESVTYRRASAVGGQPGT